MGLLSYFTGPAAKAGIAFLTGLIGAPAIVAGAESATGEDLGLTLLGYLLVGVAQGFIGWVTVYMKANKPG